MKIFDRNWENLCRKLSLFCIEYVWSHLEPVKPKQYKKEVLIKNTIENIIYMYCARLMLSEPKVLP